jgi:hypothetical protein
MITKQSLVYSRSSAARVLGVDAKEIVDFRVWKYVCFVVVKGSRATFVSKKLFRKEFSGFRQRSGAALFEAGQVSDRAGTTYAVASSKGDSFYQVEVSVFGLKCQCEDHKNQMKHFGVAACKHSYGVIASLGLSTLAEYMAAAKIAAQAKPARVQRVTAHHYRANLAA